MLKLRKEHRWMLVSSVASVTASHLARRAVTASWRLAAGKEPPEDPAYEDVDWPSAITWAAAAGAVGALSQLVARHGAAVVWKQVTGKRPPKPRRRRRASEPQRARGRH